MDLLIAPGTVDASKADTAPATGTPGWATDGDPVKQIARTVFPAYAYNALLAEIYNVIVGAKLTPDRNDNTQLFKAISQLATEEVSAFLPLAGGILSGPVIGIPVSDWTTRQLVNALDADARYIQKGKSAYDYSPMAAGINRSSGEIWLNYEDDSGNAQWAFAQPAGDYATNPALNTEITNRTNADSNLQSQINNRVQKTGDTIDWLTITGGSVTTTGYSGNDGVSGGIAYATGLTSTKQTGDVSVAIYRFINQNGLGPFATIWLTDNQGNGHELRYGADDRLRTASGNVFALTSELPLPAGQIIQAFVASVSGSGVHYISFPAAFSASPITIVISNGLTNGNNSPVSVLSGWTNTGFEIQTNGDTSVNFLAVGDK